MNQSSHNQNQRKRFRIPVLSLLLIGCFLIQSVYSAENQVARLYDASQLYGPKHFNSHQPVPPLPVTSQPEKPEEENTGWASVTISELNSDSEDTENLPEPASSPEPEQEELYNPFAERVEYNPCVEPDEAPLHWEITECFFDALTKPEEPMAQFFGSVFHSEHLEPHTKLDVCPIGLQPIPERPCLFVEQHEKFLSPGFLKQGITLPTGAVWRPAFWVFGQYRTGISYSDNLGGRRFTEWANRLDLFGQMNLTGTERLLIGLRPLDKELKSSRQFTSYEFQGGDWIDGWNSNIQTLFFEGDVGEIFPNLDPYDVKEWDIGFSVGRQPMLFQQGLLINEDLVDAVTVTRNTLSGHGALNVRATAVFVEDNINRNNNVQDNQSQMVGLFTETDTARSTINADVAYVYTENDTFGSLLAVGLSSIQRFHGFHNTYNTSFHILASFPTENETQASGQGELLFSQISWTAHHSQDLIYLNGFWAIDQFTSPARGTLAGGPLGQTGILFAAPGLGQFGAPLSNQASDAVGGSLGYQMFYNDSREQIIFEIGGRKDTNNIDQGAIATGLRFQKAIGQHWIFIMDGFVTKMESVDTTPGARVEFLAKF